MGRGSEKGIWFEKWLEMIEVTEFDGRKRKALSSGIYRNVMSELSGWLQCPMF